MPFMSCPAPAPRPPKAMPVISRPAPAPRPAKHNSLYVTSCANTETAEAIPLKSFPAPAPRPPKAMPVKDSLAPTPRIPEAIPSILSAPVRGSPSARPLDVPAAFIVWHPDCRVDPRHAAHVAIPEVEPEAGYFFRVSNRKPDALDHQVQAVLGTGGNREKRGQQVGGSETLSWGGRVNPDSFVKGCAIAPLNVGSPIRGLHSNLLKR